MSNQLTERFRQLHVKGNPLRLLNAWDGGSARMFEKAGAPAIGTTSGGIAFSLGRPDGENLTRDEIVDATARIAGAVKIPVSADIESGFADSARDVRETARRIVAAGAIGINIEDVSGEPVAPLRAMSEQIARITAARNGAEQEGVELFVNARTDVYLLQVGPPHDRLSRTRARLREFENAGANCVFVPGAPADVIEELVESTSLPMNILLSPRGPSVDELAALDVARVSTGSGPQRAVLGLAGRMAKEFLADGSLAAFADGAPTYVEANALFSH